MEEIEQYKTEVFDLIKHSFGIACNASDFFAYASACTVIIDPSDLKWVLPIYRQFGGAGLDACMSHIAKMDPIKPHQTEKFFAARTAILMINPTVMSEL